MDRNRRWIAATILILALVAGARLVARRRASPTRASDTAEFVSNPGAASEFVAPPDGAQREPVALEAPIADGRRVLVVRADTKAPVPGALVTWLGSTALESSAVEPDVDGVDGPTELLERLGRRTRTDEHGLAFLPADEPLLLLEARKGNLWGETVPVARDDLRLELRPELVIETVDARGAPLRGVRLTVEARLDGETRSSVTGQTSGPAARYTLPRSALPALHAWLEASSAHRPQDLELTVEIPLTGVRRTLALDAIPEEPVRLVVPSSGRVVLEVRDAEGRPYRHAASARLVNAAEEMPDDPPADVRLRDGRMTFEHVALGIELHARAYLFHALDLPPDEVAYAKECTSLDVRASAPARADEEVRIVLSVAARDPVLVGRLVGARGKPLAKTRVQVRLRDPESVGSGETDEGGESEADEALGSSPLGEDPSDRPLETDADGRFELVLRGGPRRAARRTLTFVLDDEIEQGRTQSGARVELERALAAERVDLGDVVVGEVPLLVSGLVRAADGAPLPRAQISVATRSSEPDGTPTWYGRFELSQARADDRGRFEIRAWPPGDELGAQALLAGRRGEIVPFTAGATGVELVLGELGSLAGSVLVERELPRGCLTVSLYREGADPYGACAGSKTFPSPDGDAGFRWTDLAAGSYRLDAELASDPRPLLSLPGIAVGAGPVRDARVALLDLRGLARVIELRVVDERGAALEQASLQTLDVEGERLPERSFYGSVASEHGVARLVLARPVSLSIEAPRRRAVRLEHVFEDRTVTLPAGLRVRFELGAGVTLPQPPRYLCAIAERAGAPSGASFTWRRDGAFFGPDRSESVWLAEPGRYRISWWLCEERGNGSGGGSGLQAPVKEIEVADEVGEQVFALELDPGVLVGK